jgi:hypothetical protein
MWGSVKLLLAVLFAGCLALVYISSNADASIGYPDAYPGAVGGEGFSVLNESAIEVVVTGSGQHFNVYIVTEESHQLQMENQSFGYIQELSRTNVTSADITGVLPVGNYWVLVQNLERGDIEIQGPTITPRSESNQAPWDLIIAVAATAVITCLATFAILRYKQKG